METINSLNIARNSFNIWSLKHLSINELVEDVKSKTVFVKNLQVENIRQIIDVCSILCVFHSKKHSKIISRPSLSWLSKNYMQILPLNSIQ